MDGGDEDAAPASPSPPLSPRWPVPSGSSSSLSRSQRLLSFPGVGPVTRASAYRRVLGPLPRASAFRRVWGCHAGRALLSGFAWTARGVRVARGLVCGGFVREGGLVGGWGCGALVCGFRESCVTYLYKWKQPRYIDYTSPGGEVLKSLERGNACSASHDPFIEPTSNWHGRPFGVSFPFGQPVPAATPTGRAQGPRAGCPCPFEANGSAAWAKNVDPAAPRGIEEGNTLMVGRFNGTSKYAAYIATGRHAAERYARELPAWYAGNEREWQKRAPQGFTCDAVGLGLGARLGC